MIPKIIHYCWFGGKELPKLAQKCINTWKIYFPDYEIKEWNESNFDINCCVYVSEAYAAKKWAFVSDYARFWILYNYGGIYFDTDVEVIKPYDNILKRGAFIGCESGSSKINPGLGIACESGLEIYKEILEFYDKLHFKNSDGTYNLQTVVEYTSDIFIKYGFQNSGNIENIEDVYIYPEEYFCPLNFRTMEMVITNKSYSIHHYSASWTSGKMKIIFSVKRILARVIGVQNVKRISYVISKYLCKR